MKVVTPEVHQAGGYGGVFLLCYAPPKSGKTRLLTSLPEEMMPAVYVCSDPKSEALKSVLPQYRKSLTLVKPGWKDAKKGEPGAVYFPAPLDAWMKACDYGDDCVAIASYPWTNGGFKTIIWDTISQSCMEALTEIAFKGWKADYGEARHVLATGTKGTIVSPNRSDYGLAQNFALKIAALLADQPMNVLIAAHQDVDDKKGVGGPQTVGVALLEEFTKYFDFVVSTGWMFDPKTKSRQNVVRTKPYKANPGNINFTAGVREAALKEVFKEDMLPVSINPSEFWQRVKQLEVSHEQQKGSDGSAATGVQ